MSLIVRTRTSRVPDSFLRLLLCAACLFAVVLPAMAAEKPRIQISDYVIDAELAPKTHHLTANAKVKFTALEDISTAIFELNNAMRVTRVTDEAGKVLPVERVTQDYTVRVTMPQGLSKGQTQTLSFDYEGVLASGDDSPVQGLKLAYVGPDTSYLLYPSRWFPMVGYGTNRFTAQINLTVPAFFEAIGSGAKPGGAHPASAGNKTFSFVWDTPSFPGTIIAGTFVPTKIGNMTMYFKPVHKGLEQVYEETAEKELAFYSTIYGPLPSVNLSIVELPDDTVPSAWAPQLIAIASKAITQKVNYRLLANNLAHQWWGVSVSPATLDDFWITEGAARDSEIRYVQDAAGEAGFEEATKDMAVGALAYNNIPLSGVGKLDPFSPEFQSLVTDKGGMIFHMLRWEIGDAAFNQTMKAMAQQYAGKSISADQFQQLAEQDAGQKLGAFFTQWIDGTGAPDFKNKYTVYRLGNNKGFRIVGQVDQDLDLFKMPIEVRVDTDGKSEMKRIEVVGTQSTYSLDTFGKPRRIVLDPNNWVLKNSPELQVRVAILRGQQLAAQGDLTEALKEYQKALDANHNSSLAHYRIAEIFFLQKNYQSAANAYREALSGDGEPKWTEVWSDIMLGKIFDITDQRDRAIGEYRQALQTNDNTQGALDEARRYLNKPYKREASPAD
ncbi:MAG TPA: M1 family aminopeptidase [Terriglobales bacterium]|nr:M1 family aminopeptidase [Terriglobales bacterium]